MAVFVPNTGRATCRFTAASAMNVTVIVPAIAKKYGCVPRSSTGAPMIGLSTPPMRPNATAVPTPGPANRCRIHVRRQRVHRRLHRVDQTAGHAEHDEHRNDLLTADVHHRQRDAAGNRSCREDQHRDARSDARNDEARRSGRKPARRGSTPAGRSWRCRRRTSRGRASTAPSWYPCKRRRSRRGSTPRSAIVSARNSGTNNSADRRLPGRLLV